MISKPVEQIKEGEFVRRIINNKECETTYKRGPYDRTYRRFSLINTNDVSREFTVKRGTMLSVGFTY